MNHARSLGTSLLFVTVASGFCLSLACGSKPAASASFTLGGDAGAPSSAPPQCQPGQPCPPPPCQPGQPCPPPATSAAPIGSVYTTDPNALAALFAAAAAAGSAWLGPAAAMADPAEAGLRLAAAQYAPGMSPEGQVAKGNVAENGHIAFIVNMDASKCYTIVAYGAGVSDLDINLLFPPVYTMLAAQDGLAGPTAVVGPSPHPVCPLTPIAVPYKVDLHAKRGGGMVAAQVYSKPR